MNRVVFHYQGATIVLAVRNNQAKEMSQDLQSDSAKYKSRNFLAAGISASLSLIQTVAGRNADSSDDEGATDQNEDEDYIQRGVRGVLVFPIISIRTGKHKVLHLNLYKSQIVLYSSQSKKKSFQCSDIVNLLRTSERNVSIEFRGVIDVQVKTKKFSFETEASAERFHQYVEFMIELGKGIKQSFNHIDYSRKGKISPEDLQSALARVDLPSDPSTVDKMSNLFYFLSHPLNFFLGFNLALQDLNLSTIMLFFTCF